MGDYPPNNYPPVNGLDLVAESFLQISSHTFTLTSGASGFLRFGKGS